MWIAQNISERSYFVFLFLLRARNNVACVRVMLSKRFRVSFSRCDVFNICYAQTFLLGVIVPFARALSHCLPAKNKSLGFKFTHARMSDFYSYHPFYIKSRSIEQYCYYPVSEKY